jgi:hypothetical protein
LEQKHQLETQSKVLSVRPQLKARTLIVLRVDQRLSELQQRLDAHEAERATSTNSPALAPPLPEVDRQEYESTIARHLSFIDQLMEVSPVAPTCHSLHLTALCGQEKGQITEQCQKMAEQLTNVSKRAEHKYELSLHSIHVFFMCFDRIKAADHRLQAELARQKKVHYSSSLSIWRLLTGWGR